MIEFKAVKLSKRVYLGAVFIVFFMLLFVFFISLYKTESVTTLSYSERQKPVTSPVYSAVNWIQRLSPEVFTRIINSSIPVIHVANRTSGNDSTGIIISAVKAVLNIDIKNPLSILFSQIPLLSKATVVVTPEPEPQLEVPSEEPQLEEQEEDVDIIQPFPEPVETEPEDPIVIHDMTNPIVLIYHTHTTESYNPSPKFQYKPSDSSYHCSDLEFSVVRVGRELKEQLEKEFKIPVIHDTTVHDEPSYMMSYANSMKTFEKNIQNHDSIKIALDIHRDAPFLDKQKSKQETTFVADGQKAARVMLVVGTDKLFEHPNWKKNYAFALKIQEKMEELYPGMARRVDVREERFNQHLVDKALLVEIGSYGNTMEEALLTAKYFARVIYEVTKGS
jgi:stage II sporulation protein P